MLVSDTLQLKVVLYVPTKHSQKSLLPFTGHDGHLNVMQSNDSFQMLAMVIGAAGDFKRIITSTTHFDINTGG